MIYVDNRALIPFALPFALLAMARLLWLVAGAEWSDPSMAAGVCAMVGGMLGLPISIALFAEGIRIGGFWIGGRK